MKLPDLGVGIVYAPGLEPLLKSGSTCVDVIEIEPQTLWHRKPGAPLSYFLPEKTRELFQNFPQPKLVHSVGFAVGGSQRLKKDFAESLSATISLLDAPWASEHLSITHVKSSNNVYHTGFMLPPLQTYEGAAVAAETIKDFASRLPVPLAVETTVNYLKPRKGELSDGEFVAIATEEADCGILLDMHNIWTNERNGRQKVADFVATIPLERVWEIHLGGGFEFEGFWLDAHSGAVPEPVMELTRDLIPHLPNLKAVIFEIFPSFIPLFGLEAVQQQIERIKDVYHEAKRAPSTPSRYQTNRSQDGAARIHHSQVLNPEAWEKVLGEVVTIGTSTGSIAKDLNQDAGISIIRKLIWKFRAGAITKALGAVIRLIILSTGEKHLEKLLDDYFRKTKPQPFASDEAKGFLNYLKSSKLEIPYLEDIVAYEEAAMLALIDENTQYLNFSYDPNELLEALTLGYIPQNIRKGNYELEILAGELTNN